jgi:hypothetical protein
VPLPEFIRLKIIQQSRIIVKINLNMPVVINQHLLHEMTTTHSCKNPPFHSQYTLGSAITAYFNGKNKIATQMSYQMAQV